MDYVEINLQQELNQAKKEIEKIYFLCKNNKKFKYKNKPKQDWYYKYLKERIQYKIYLKYRLTAFGIIERHIDSILPKSINNNFCQFTDIRNAGLGDKNE